MVCLRFWAWKYKLDDLLHTPEGVIILDQRWRVRCMNPAAETIAHMSSQDAVGRNVDALFWFFNASGGKTVLITNRGISRPFLQSLSVEKNRWGKVVGYCIFLVPTSDIHPVELASIRQRLTQPV
jgi:hypothetical protein